MSRPRTAPAIVAAASLVAALLAAAGAHAQDAAVPSAPPAWLVGCWQGLEGTSAAGAFEVWLAPRAGQMLGLSQTVRAAKQVGFEYMRIENTDGRLLFVPQPYGRTAVELTATVIEATRLTFTNPQLEFPRAIDYRLEGERLVVGLGRIPEQAQASRAFQFRRVACDLVFANR